MDKKHALKYSNKFEDNLIYDIFHNTKNNLVVISPTESEALNISYKGAGFKLIKCPHNHTYIYISSTEVEYKELIDININGKSVNIRINKYPEFKNQIIMSTMVLGEDKYVRQWIQFHLKLGIEHFIIYDNSTSSNSLINVLEDYIDQNIVTLIKWPYKYRLEISGISGQTTQQNHSIYAFNNSKYIGFFDIDEYLNLQSGNDVALYLDATIKSNNLDPKNICAFEVKNKFFHNPHNLPDDGFNFLKIFNCETVRLSGAQKNFLIPSNVESYSVHEVTRQKSGTSKFELDPQDIYFNHYLFLNKQNKSEWYYDGHEKHSRKLKRGLQLTQNMDASILSHFINEEL
jgi:hypothetical protein